MTPDVTATVSIGVEDERGVMYVRSWLVSRDAAAQVAAMLGEPKSQVIADLTAQDQMADALQHLSGLVTDGGAE
ncbi:hypothetical protein [Sphaerimonospora thailandensis]|uniref:Uncharacterized protein n=1 Tax=Sphaerimonospora thailandensis TaxID=795644 RepID=A0A8J3VYY0_9ACTN|nr:hypothetical protein [Sphaerimonospora thailandensis]GIH69470.1 hypothetical protein Mth01_17230 [Sphaerimonospora thailandensis]